jgi:tetratricopeptide (TPR) repeat protein
MLIEALVATTLLRSEAIADLDARLENGAMLVQHARYSEAESVLRSVIEDLDESDSRRGPALNNLGAALYYSGQTQGVEEIYIQALRAIGDRSPKQIASIKNNLATLYRRTGRFQESEALYLDVLHYHEMSSSDRIRVATDLDRLAQLYQSMGRYTESEQFARRSVAILAEAGPAYELAYSDSLQTLAIARHLQAALDDAEKLTRHALEIRESTQPPNDARIAGSLSALGQIRMGQRDYAEAEQLLRRALEILRTTVGSHHPDVAATTNNIAQVCKFTGRYAQAEDLYRKALEIWAASLGEDSLDYGRGAGNLADLFRIEGKLFAAAGLYRRALNNVVRHAGPTHPDVALFSAGLEEAVRANVLQRVDTISFRELVHD